MARFRVNSIVIASYNFSNSCVSTLHTNRRRDHGIKLRHQSRLSETQSQALWSCVYVCCQCPTVDRSNYAHSIIGLLVTFAHISLRSLIFEQLMTRVCSAVNKLENFTRRRARALLNRVTTCKTQFTQLIGSRAVCTWQYVTPQSLLRIAQSV